MIPVTFVQNLSSTISLKLRALGEASYNVSLLAVTSETHLEMIDHNITVKAVAPEGSRGFPACNKFSMNPVKPK